MSAGAWEIRQGDAVEQLRAVPAESVQVCVTSPPYYGLRDYGTAKWEGGDEGCDHQPRRWDGPKQTQGAISGHASKADRLAREECRCGAKRIDSQLGLEPTPAEYVANLVAVFREVRRVLRDDGTLWLNLGDSYAGSGPSGASYQSATTRRRAHGDGHDGAFRVSRSLGSRGLSYGEKKPVAPPGYKSKDLLGIPWQVAFALRDDGWWLRSEIVWAKPNPMPESVTDRPTRAHEQVFLLSKSARYFYDADAVREPHAETERPQSEARRAQRMGRAVASVNGLGQSSKGIDGGVVAAEHTMRTNPDGRNKRSVWTVATQPYPEAHFATFPPKLVEPMVLAGSAERACGECGAPWERVVERKPMVVREGPGRAGAMGASVGSSSRTQVTGTMLEAPSSKTIGFEPSCSHDDDSGHSTVLDPFSGAGTTGLVALRHNRSYVGIELNPDYCELARNRIRDDAPLFNVPAEVAA